MAIAYVGGATGTTSATLPTFTPGDIAIVWAYRDGNNTAPSLPAGWTNLNATGANTNSARIGYRELQSGDTTTGTWTSATSVIVQVYSGAMVGGNVAVNSGASTTVNYPALTLVDSSGSSWVVGFGGHRSPNTGLETPPAGMVNRAVANDATDEAVAHDTNGGVTAWASTNVNVGGTSSGWRTAVVELLEKPPPAVRSELIATTAGVATGGAAGITLNTPAGVAEGDSLIAWFASQNFGSTFSLPSGWSLISGTEAVTGLASCAMYRREVTASEPPTVSVTNSGNNAMSGWIMAFRDLGAATSVGRQHVASTDGANLPTTTVSVADPYQTVVFAAALDANRFINTDFPVGYEQPAIIRSDATSPSGAFNSNAGGFYGEQIITGSIGLAADVNLGTYAHTAAVAFALPDQGGGGSASADAAVLGTGSAAAELSARAGASAAVTGSGMALAAGVVLAAAVGAVSGSGSTTATATVLIAAAASTGGAGAVSATAALPIAANAAVQGQGTAVASLAVAEPGAASINAAVTVQATPRQRPQRACRRPSR